MDSHKDDSWGEPYEFDGEDENYHLNELEAAIPDEMLAETHEALSRMYHKSLKRHLKKVERKTKGWQ